MEFFFNAYRYFYTGYLMIPVLPKPLLHLKIAAERLGVSEINDETISEKLAFLLSPRNCWALREIAGEAGLQKFESCFQNWTQTNFLTLFADQDFLLTCKVKDVSTFIF